MLQINHALIFSRIKHVVQHIRSICTNWIKTQLGKQKSQIDMVKEQDMLTKYEEIQEKFKQWFNTLNSLHMLIMLLKKERNHLGEIDLEALSQNTYLYHIDRILIKVRDQFYTYKYKVTSLKENENLLTETPFAQINKAIEQVCSTMVDLQHLLSTKKLHILCENKKFINKMHQLELNSSAVISAINNLNLYINQKETLDQLDILEKTLMESLTLTIDSRKEILPYIHNADQIDFRFSVNTQGNNLRKKAECIDNEQDRVLLLSLINILETLKRCYIVVRKSTVNNTLDEMYHQLDNLREVFISASLEKESILHLLNQFYSSIESIRFSTNRESRCSRNLFDKAKIGKHQMRQACLNHELGIEFIKSIAIKRMDRLRHKIKLG